MHRIVAFADDNRGSLLQILRSIRHFKGATADEVKLTVDHRFQFKAHLVAFFHSVVALYQVHLISPDEAAMLPTVENFLHQVSTLHAYPRRRDDVSFSLPTRSHHTCHLAFTGGRGDEQGRLGGRSGRRASS